MVRLGEGHPRAIGGHLALHQDIGPPDGMAIGARPDGFDRFSERLDVGDVDSEDRAKRARAGRRGSILDGERGSDRDSAATKPRCAVRCGSPRVV
jgi:hypothetical protein